MSSIRFGRLASLGVAAAISAALWILVVTSGGSRTGRVDEPVKLTDSDPMAARSLELRVGEDAKVVVADAGSYKVDGQVANADVVTAILTTLGYSYGRRLDPGRGRDAKLGLADGEGVVELVATFESNSMRLRRGTSVADEQLVWISRGSDAVLVTKTEADLLFPPLASLLDNQPLRTLTLSTLTRLTVALPEGEAFALAGDPIALVSLAGTALAPPARIDRATLSSLVSALRGLRLKPGDPAAAQDVAALRVRTSWGTSQSSLRIYGDCGHQRSQIEVQGVWGCVDAEAIASLAELAAKPTALVGHLLDRDRTLESATLDRAGKPIKVAIKGDGQEAALRWLAHLRGTPLRQATGQGAQLATITLSYAGGESERLLIVRRGQDVFASVDGQPVVWKIRGSDAAELLAAEAHTFRADSLSSRDPTEIRTVTIGERVIAGDQLPAAARRALAHLSAVRFVAAKADPSHRLASPQLVVAAEFNPPPIATGDPDRLVLELGAETTDGCFARLKGDPVVFVLAAQSCRALLEL